MKILVKVILSFVLLVSGVFIPLQAEKNVEATDNTFADIKKITRNTDVSRLYVFEDKLITTYRYYANQPTLITSYSKTGNLNWERSESGLHAIAENKFARIENNILYIHSTVTGEVLISKNLPYSASKIYMNESFIMITNKSGFYVYDTNGNTLMREAVNIFSGAALIDDVLILQDSQGVYSYNLTTRKKMWSVFLEASFNSAESLLKPIGNVLYAQGIEKRDETVLLPPKDVLLSINATTGGVFYKKDFGNYEETWAQVKDYGLHTIHEAEDVSNVFHVDGTLKMSMKMESEAIKEMKLKYPVYASRYNGALDFKASKDGIYYFRTYADPYNNVAFSSIKSIDNKGAVKFEKIMEEHVFSIATTHSNKLFVAHGNSHGYYANELNKLSVYHSDGTLLDTIETEYIQQLKSDGSNLYGYGGSALYIFKESEPPKSLPLPNKVTHQSTRVIGTAEAGSKITIHSGNTVIGTATADAAGKYTIPIVKQKIGAMLTIGATDTAGNRSVPLVITVVDGNYRDLNITHWALDKIMYLADDRIIGGYPNGEFQPEKKTTRAEAAKMLALAMDLPIENVSSAFKDVSDKHWAKNYIAAASKAGLFVGNPDGTFAPEAVLKRAEMAKVISVAYELKASDNNHFKDVKSAYWAKSYIQGLYENQITVGYPDNTFRPEESTTRAEFSVFLARALNEQFR